MKKLIVSDYDQTFYLNDEDIEKNKILVDKFVSNGNIFVIATGRSHYDFINKLNQYNFDYHYVIINHGATILDKENNVISVNYIDDNIKDKIIMDLDIKNSISHFCCNL